MRQGTPLAPCPIQVQNGIDHFSHVGGSWVSTWLGGRDERLEDGPFLLGQIDFSNCVFSLLHLLYLSPVSSPTFYHFPHSLSCSNW
jgi:hypothetical protein